MDENVLSDEEFAAVVEEIEEGIGEQRDDAELTAARNSLERLILSHRALAAQLQAVTKERKKHTKDIVYLRGAHKDAVEACDAERKRREAADRILLRVRAISIHDKRAIIRVMRDEVEDYFAKYKGDEHE